MRLLFLLCLCSLAHATESWRDAVIIPDGDIVDVLRADMTDLECLAYNIYHESRGEGRFGMELVAQVTMSRVWSRHFHNSACEVVKRPKQFSWTRDGKSDMTNSEPVKWAESYLIAIDFLYNGKRLKIDGIDVSRLLFYHAPHVSPKWVNVREVMRYNNHIFYESTLTDV